MVIISSITSEVQRSEMVLAFLIWAKNEPQEFLSIYPVAAKELSDKMKIPVRLIGIVDDLLPKIVLKRSDEEQNIFSTGYQQKMFEYGFENVVMVSKIITSSTLSCVNLGENFTTSQFVKLLPKKKINKFEKLSLFEIIEFLWQVKIISEVVNQFNTDGFLAGIRSEYFYYSVRQMFKSQDIYFVGTQA